MYNTYRLVALFLCSAWPLYAFSFRFLCTACCHLYAAKGHDLTQLHNAVAMGDGLILCRRLIQVRLLSGRFVEIFDRFSYCFAFEICQLVSPFYGDTTPCAILAWHFVFVTENRKQPMPINTTVLAYRMFLTIPACRAALCIHCIHFADVAYLCNLLQRDMNTAYYACNCLVVVGQAIGL